jgi:hypothetical protein
VALSILLSVAPSQCTPEQIDSFCKLYTRVVINKGDEQIKAPLEVKKRLLENELLFKAECLKPSVS